MINIDSLKLFMEVMKYKSISVAANQNYISQSSLSKQMAKLENELGEKLFERKKNAIKLTKPGEVLYTGLKGHIEAIENAMDSVKNYSVAEEVRILSMVPHTLGFIYIDDIFKEIQKKHPDIKITVTEGKEVPLDYLDAIFALQNGKYDVALIYPHGDEKTLLDWNRLLNDEFCIVMPKGHELAGKEKTYISDLAPYEIRITSKYVFDTLRALAANNGVALNLVCDDMKGPKRAVTLARTLDENGLAIFHRSEIALFNMERFEVRSIQGIPNVVMVYAWKKGEVLSEAARIVYKSLKEALHERMITELPEGIKHF